MDSILEDSVMDDYGPSSEDFSPEVVPAAKAKPAAALKKAASAAALKPTKSTTKGPTRAKILSTLSTKSAATKKRPRSSIENDDSEDEDSSDFDAILSATPPKEKKQKNQAPNKGGSKPLQDLEHGATGLDDQKSQKAKTSAGATERYQKLTQLEHILKRPDTYVGSVERTEKQMWVYNSQTESIQMRDVSYVPGLYKIFDEILVNAADNKQNDKNMDTIKVTVDREKGEISVWNNGKGIPIEIHEKEKIYIPEMIFGHLLTSSNYDDDQQKVTGGRNGYGAKLCNIFSTSFTVETADSNSKKKYKQTWTANMSKVGKAEVTANKKDDYTKVTFTPDFTKFGMEGMDDDFEALVKRRVYDLAGTLHGVKVLLNEERLKIRNFKQYVEMYVKAINQETGEGSSDATVPTILTDQPNARWEIGFAVSDGSFQQVSFVNSIATTSGGTHVNYVGDQIINRLMEIVKKKNKNGATLKPHQIRNHIFLFVNAQIVNPAFTSQTKEQLTTKSSQFGSKCVVSDEFLKKVAKTQAVENILHFAQQKADQVMKKSDGNRRSRINNPKLVDANKAGTKDGWKCTLILTEGDSAKGLAMAGRSVVGPDEFGVFPLRGKLLNVRDASVDQISKNAEIQSIKQFLGLQHKKEYTDTRSLRYGHIMIMTDQDHDGSHIKGLLINFLQCAFPSLLKIPQFLIEFITPIVKVWHGDPKRPSWSRSFFTIPEYEVWKESNKNMKYEHKYYKGLGTSTTEDAQVYFRDLDRHLKEFHTMQQNEDKLIDLAFSKKKADERKEWLRQFKPGTFLDHSIDKITYTDFINKELILFSMADNMRSIPSVIDGLKPGQRKVLYTCFKRNLVKDMKVFELGGLVSGLTAYHHGDTSLQQTIVGLAQTFVGSNNINCLEPSGNFGSRLQGGSDCASARYIYTRLSPFARRIFSPLDEPLLTYNIDENKQIEPETYCPTVPLVLINGADGIGTGWSSSIPNYNPEDVVANLRRLMNDEPQVPMVPWFRGWAGEVQQIAPDRYKFSGIVKPSGHNEVEITELPIRLWTQDFKDRLEEIIKAEKTPSFIKDYTDYNTHVKVHFIVQMEDKNVKVPASEDLLEKFKLSRSIATSNLVAFDKNGRLHKYNNVEEIMEEFYHHRLMFYQKRKAHQLAEFQKSLDKMTNQARFVQMIIDGQLIVSKKKKAVLVAELKKRDFKPFPKVKDAAKHGELEPVVEGEDADDDLETGASAYDYLLGMAIWSLTQERVDRLLQQIGDKEREIDMLLKLSPKDLWSRDLDEFIGEWRFQIEDDNKRQKRNASLGRRASMKLKVGAKVAGAKKGAKAKDDDTEDSDYPVVKPKRTGSGPTRVQQKPVSDFFEALKAHPPIPKRGVEVAKPAADRLKAALAGKPATTIASLDGSSDPLENTRHEGVEILDAEQKSEKNIVAASKPKGAVAAKVAKLASEVVKTATVPARRARLAASKPRKYHVDSDTGSDSDDNGNGMLGDVGKMVKGIGRVADSNLGVNPLFSATTTTTTVSTSKPNGGLGAAKPSLDLSEDETDFSKLAPEPIKAPSKAGTEGNAAKGNNSDSNLLGDDNSSSEIELPVPTTTASASTAPAPASSSTKAVRVRAKPGPKLGRTPAAKPAKTTAATARLAKAVTATTAAAKGGKGVVKGKAVSGSAAASKPDVQKTSIESDLDDDDDVDHGGALNGLDSEENSSDVEMSDASAPAPVPTRRAIAPAPASTSTGRPARRAAATAAASKAGKYIDSDSDTEEEEADDDDDEDGFDEDDDSE